MFMSRQMSKKQTEGRAYQEVLQDFRRKAFAPLYFFFGEEDLLIDEACDLLVSQALDEPARSFNLDVAYGSEADAKSIVSIAMAFPMMSDRRVVVVREFDKLPNKEPLVAYAGRPSPSTVLFLSCAKPDFRTKPYQALREHAVVVECKQLYDNEIPQWITGRVESRGKSISYQAADLICRHIGRSLREISNELDKLMVYTGDRPSVDLDDVEAVVGISKQYNIFELQQAIGSRTIARALDILGNMLTAGESPVGIVVMLTRFFERLLQLKEALARNLPRQEMMAMVKFSPRQAHFLEQELTAARAFSEQELEYSFTRLIDADERLKSSDGDPKLVMTLLLDGLVNRRQEAHVPA
jgi:DNA polymerase-3 subunit delta